ncbi:MAG: bacteriocin transport accessory protein [Ruminococcus sp.]|nr:bacteriocin transport accessory protein [Ruminococcus sp.]
MKKIISLFLAGVMMLAMVSCSESKKEDSKKDVSAESPLALLNTVWDSYSDDEKFPVAGGDYTEENQNPEGPGKYSLDDPNAVENALGMPIESVSKLEDAASIMHMMNANNFTCSVLRAKKSDDVSTLAKDMKESILHQRQWMCGIPDKVVFYTIGKDLITAFGKTEFIDTFKTKFTKAFPDAKLVSEDNIIE